MVWELGSCLILCVSLCIFFIRTATVIKEKSGYDMMQEAANQFEILEHDIQFLWLHTLSTVKFGINVRLFRIVFLLLAVNLARVTSNYVFSNSNKSLLDSSFCLFLYKAKSPDWKGRPASRPSPIFALDEYTSWFALTLLWGCQTLCLEWNLTSSISE